MSDFSPIVSPYYNIIISPDTTIIVSPELPSEQPEVSEDLYDDLYEVLETEPAVISQTTAAVDQIPHNKSPTFAPSSRTRAPSGRFIYRGGGSGTRVNVVYLVVSVLSYLAY